MKKDTFYFSHDYHARSDEKIINLLSKTGAEGYGIFWMLIEKLYECGGFLEQNYQSIAFDLRTNCERITDVIENYGLFKIKDGRIYSESVLVRLRERKGKSERARQSVNFRWNKQKNNDTNVLRTQYDRNTRKERKGNIYIADTSAQDFSFSQKLEAMKTSKDKRMTIIASYWETKCLNFENDKTYSSALRRELRPAGNLIGYEIEKIVKTMDWLKANADYKWTLETVHKYIDEHGTQTEKLNSDIFF